MEDDKISKIIDLAFLITISVFAVISLIGLIILIFL